MHQLVPGAVAVLVLTGPRLMVAQSPVAGTWIAEFDVGIRIQNGVESSAGKGHARVTLAVKGDSVSGIWQNLGLNGAPSGDPRPIRGAVAGGGVKLETATPREIVMRTPDGETRIQAILTYDLTVRSDSLVGTEQWVAVDRSSRGPVRPFAATREKRT